MHSSQFQNELCALALWKLEENNSDPRVATAELRRAGLNEEQIEQILNRAKGFMEERTPANPGVPGIAESTFEDENFQKEKLDFAKTIYFQNNHSYEVVEKKLAEKGLNKQQIRKLIEHLKNSIAAMVSDFQEKLDSGVISEIKIKPSPDHQKGAVGKDQVDRYIGYGAYQMERGDLDNALELFDKALELDDKATLAYANKGTLFSKKGDSLEALHFYNKALELEPDHIAILENKMDLLFEIMDESNEPEFIDTVKRLLKSDSEHPNALIYIIQYHLKENDIEAALSSVKALFKNYHSENTAIQLLLDVFHKLPHERSMSEFEQFQKDLDEQAAYQLQYCKGIYLKGVQRYDESISTFEQLNRVHEFSWNYYQIAIMKALQNKPDESLRLLASAFRLEPDLKQDAKQFPELESLYTNPTFIELTR